LKTRTIAIFILLACYASFAQRNATPEQKAKRPSPPATAQCKLPDGNTVTTDYSQPSMRGRKIYGGLVPYDQVWRTGANEATTFVTTANLLVGGANVPAGSYTLFTLPLVGTWKLIISKKTGEWGIPYPGEQFDLARVDMKTEPLSSPVEKFTISYDQTGDGCTMHLDWEKTRESIQIQEKK
jgi:hypothetical protein